MLQGLPLMFLLSVTCLQFRPKLHPAKHLNSLN
jgi:hypothetical protein